MIGSSNGAGARRRGARREPVLRDSRGAVFLEFAIIAVPLTVLLLGVILAGINLAAATALDNAAREAADAIYVSDSSYRGTDDSQIRSLICQKMASFMPCGSLAIHVASGITFSAVPVATLANGTLSLTGYSPGTAGSSVLLQLAIKSPLGFNPFISGNSDPVFMSTVAFQNEP